MSRKPQQPKWQPEKSQDAPRAAVTDASPVTKASPRRKPLKTNRLPNGALVETY